MSRFFKRTISLGQKRFMDAESLDLDHVISVVKEKVDKRIAVDMSSAYPIQEAEPQANPQHSISLPKDATLLLAGVEVSSPSAVEAFERLRHRLTRHQERVPAGSRCTVITSADACEGKTLVTINLALSCAKVHKTRVLLVDADLRSQGLSRLLGTLAAPGLAEILAGITTYDSAISHTNIICLDVLGAGNLASPSAELLSGQAWKDFVAWGAENYDLVLVDSPPILRVADCDLIAAVSTGILLVARARRTRRGALEKALDHVETSKLVGVVFNDTDEDGAPDYYRRYYRRAAQGS